MNRRTLISAVGTAILAGCNSGGEQGTNNDQLTVNAEAVAPGQTGTIIIKTNQTQYIDNGAELIHEPIKIDYDNVNFSTPPNLTEASIPPGWRWHSTQNLTVKIPYHVPPDTQPGNYTGSISIEQDLNSSTSTTEEYTITVVNDTK